MMLAATQHILGALALGAGATDTTLGIESDPIGSAPNGFERLSETILSGAIDVGIVATCVGIGFCLWRLTRGPTLIDRGVAADTISLQVVGLVLLLSVRLGSLVDFDAVLIISILGFVSTVAFAQFIGRRGAAT